MKSFETCPVCGGALIEKEVEKLLRGGNDTAIVTVQAEVCLSCGERIYSEGTVRRLEEIRRKLASQQTRDFRKVGTSFEVL